MACSNCRDLEALSPGTMVALDDATLTYPVRPKHGADRYADVVLEPVHGLYPWNAGIYIDGRINTDSGVATNPYIALDAAISAAEKIDEEEIRRSMTECRVCDGSGCGRCPSPAESDDDMPEAE